MVEIYGEKIIEPHHILWRKQEEEISAKRKQKATRVEIRLIKQEFWRERRNFVREIKSGIDMAHCHSLMYLDRNIRGSFGINLFLLLYTTPRFGGDEFWDRNQGLIPRLQSISRFSSLSFSLHHFLWNTLFSLFADPFYLMEPLAERSKSDNIHIPENPYIPEHILDHMILPCLPFKTLRRFQCVSKRYLSLIGHDPLFPSDQARLLSPSSTDLVHLSSNGRLSFLINPESIGIPDPSLQFLSSLSNYVLQLVCSTNGLLLFYGSFKDSKRWRCLCLCNPATQEKVFVPSTQYMHMLNLGLAFDPSNTPDRYMIVSPRMKWAMDGDSCSFDIFRSDTGKWSRSNKKVPVDEPYCIQKTEHVQGVIFWQFSNYIIFYSTEKDLAGSVPLPRTTGYWSMGGYAGGFVCCNTWAGGVEVWRLTNGTHWDRLHNIHWDSRPLQLQLNPTWLKTKLGLFRPLAFDGHYVYLLDSLNQEVYTAMQAYTEILGYNICTQQLEQKGEIVSTRFTNGQFYDYHNSMAPLPKILG